MSEKKNIVKLRNKLQKRYLTYTINIMRTKILLELCKDHLKDFPESINPGLKKVLEEDMKKLNKSITDGGKVRLKPLSADFLAMMIVVILDIDKIQELMYIETTDRGELLAKDVFNDGMFKETADLEHLGFNKFVADWVKDPNSISELIKPEYIDKRFAEILDINSFLYEIEFIFIFSNVDAFLYDALKIILQANPQHLKKSTDKNLSFIKLVDLGNYDNIINEMTQFYLKKFQRKSLLEKLTYIRKFGLDDLLDKYDNDFIGKAYRTRNLIVHYNCIADKNYEETYGDSKIKAGEKIRIDKQLIDDTTDELSKIVAYINDTINDNHLKL